MTARGLSVPNYVAGWGPVPLPTHKRGAEAAGRAYSSRVQVNACSKRNFCLHLQDVK
jgi:hypothetical protein